MKTVNWPLAKEQEQFNKNCLFNNCARTTKTNTMQKNDFRLRHYTHHENCQMNQKLNIKHRIIILIEDNVGEKQMTLNLVITFKYNNKEIIHERNHQ